MKKSAAQLKKEQRANNVALGRVVNFQRQVTKEEAEVMSKALAEFRKETSK